MHPKPSHHLVLDVDIRLMLQEQRDQGFAVILDSNVQGCLVILYAPVGKEKMVSEARGVRRRVDETEMENDRCMCLCVCVSSA